MAATVYPDRPLAVGELVFLSTTPAPGHHVEAFLPAGLGVGARLAPADAPRMDPVLETLAVGWLPPAPLAGDGAHAVRGLWAKALRAIPAGRMECVVTKRGYALAWVTLSDSAAAGERADKSGPAVAEVLAPHLSLDLVQGFLLPDDEGALRALVMNLAAIQRYDLVVTTGGTGLAPSDVTPEALAPILERRLPGVEQAMLAASLAKTPTGSLTRAVAGALARSLVLALPGSPRAVTENLQAVAPALAHGLAKLQGDPTPCGTVSPGVSG